MTVKDFAKIFSSEKTGQVLVVADTDSEDRPALIFSCTPHEKLGVCSFKLSFSDDDEGYQARDEALEKTTEEIALKLATEHMIDPVEEAFS